MPITADMLAVEIFADGGRDLTGFSLATVGMFHRDAVSTGYWL